jgi:hypothetical protein
LTARRLPGTVGCDYPAAPEFFSLMLTVTSLWIPFTIIAALGQVARNAMQRSLTGPLGTWGATNIRFSSSCQSSDGDRPDLLCDLTDSLKIAIRGNRESRLNDVDP